MSESSGSRRSFLNPRNLGKVVSSITGGEWPSFSPFPSGGVGGRGPGAEGESEGLLYRVGRPAMAAQFEILFEVFDAQMLPVAESALEIIDTLEAQLSAYRDSSEICEINRKAHQHPVEVEVGLFGLLQECRQIWDEVSGAFDISIQALLEVWGVFRPPRRTPSQSEIEEALTRCGMDAVELKPLMLTSNGPLPPTPSCIMPAGMMPKGKGEEMSEEEDWERSLAHLFPREEGVGRSRPSVGGGSRKSIKGGTIRFQRPGLGLNLGAVGKGYALDRVAEYLKQRRMEHFLIHGGGSSMLARGSSTWEAGWLAGVTTPFDWSNPIAHVRLEDKALSTSAVEAEALRGETTPHVLDPRTGQPVATDLVSATVITASASRAEGLSTAFLVMGLDKVLEYCEKHPDVGVVLLQWSPGDPRFEVVHTGIPKHSLEVLS